MDPTSNGKPKKSKSFLVRVEEDVHDFYEAEAVRRRISVAQIVRELLYRNMEERQKKGDAPHG